MKFSLDTRSYLSGEKFSSGLAVPIAGRETSISHRFDVLSQFAADKTVIHVGFADHAELVDKKIRRDDWLHARLSRAAKRCIGVDVNVKAVEHLRTAHGLSDLYVHDLTAPELLPAITESHWDWLFLPEVVEHVDNPVQFLGQIRSLYGSYFDRALITAPNAFELTNWRFLLRQQECVNTDHRYWFTPFTLAKVCERAGWQVEEFSFCQSYLPSTLWEKALLRRLPALRESVIMVIRAR